tara:strand:- start:2784 stop:3014 length:231 start_codon:yes stop_codon:yes gene_type:complete
MIDIEDVRRRNHFAILNTATGRHLADALKEIETIRASVIEHICDDCESYVNVSFRRDTFDWVFRPDAKQNSVDNAE